MPGQTRSESGIEESVFLSPEKQFQNEGQEKDQGASPALRRSNRKRKSTASATDMTKNSGSKKKKGSSAVTVRTEEPGRSMPKLPRTPQGTASASATTSQHTSAGAVPQPQTAASENVLERLLQGMETRLMTRMEATNKAVGEAVALSRATNESLVTLEEKVNRNEEAVKKAIEEVELRMMDKLQDVVKDMVTDQLRTAGFDPDLTAGALPTPTPAKNVFTYASAACGFPAGERTSSEVSIPPEQRLIAKTSTQQERQESRFWECRQTLRLWPVPGGSRQAFESFLKDKLRLDESFIRDELGEVDIRRHRDPRTKTKEEVIVRFESKEIRDTVRAQAPNLANFQESGMRLHIPNHLQKDFKALMGLSFDMKKRHPHLRRNVKFDENDHGLFMDMQLEREGSWRRVKPEQARQALSKSGKLDRTGPVTMAADEVVDLLGESESGDASQNE